MSLMIAMGTPGDVGEPALITSLSSSTIRWRSDNGIIDCLRVVFPGRKYCVCLAGKPASATDDDFLVDDWSYLRLNCRFEKIAQKSLVVLSIANSMNMKSVSVSSIPFSAATGESL